MAQTLVNHNENVRRLTQRSGWNLLPGVLYVKRYESLDVQKDKVVVGCPLVESENGGESSEEGQSEGEEDEGAKEQCHYCPQMVSQSNLRRHEKLHFLKNAQFRCEQCTFGSSSRRAVTRHMKVHRSSDQEQTGKETTVWFWDSWSKGLFNQRMSTS